MTDENGVLICPACREPWGGDRRSDGSPGCDHGGHFYLCVPRRPVAPGADDNGTRISTSKERTMHRKMHTITSILSIPEGVTAHMVRYRSNADCGYTEEFFGPGRGDEAAARVRDLRESPPEGNEFHPAPDGDLDIRLLRIERMSADESGRERKTLIDLGLTPGQADELLGIAIAAGRAMGMIRLPENIAAAIHTKRGFPWPCTADIKAAAAAIAKKREQIAESHVLNSMVDPPGPPRAMTDEEYVLQVLWSLRGDA